MTVKSIASVKADFVSAAVPTESDFIDLIDSTYTGEIGAALVSAVDAGGTGLFRVDSASAATLVTAGSAGSALLGTDTVASARTVLEAGSAGEAIFLSETGASARTFIAITSATTTEAGIIEIATTAEVTAGTDATRAVTPAGLARYTILELDTEQASTSGTAIDFTGITADAKRITVLFNGVSTSGTSDLIVQLGDSGGFETSGYVGSVTSLLTGASPTSNISSGFPVADAVTAAAINQGALTLTYMGSNTWTAHWIFGRSDAALCGLGGGSKTLTDTLTQVRITTVGGTDTFDAGAINILVER